MAKFNISKRPEDFSAIDRDKSVRLVLGLDLGTTTGYGYSLFRKDGDPVASIKPYHLGQIDLSAGSYDSGAIRFVRLRQCLSFLKPDLIFYEDVKNNPPKIDRFSAASVIRRIATASELIGAFRATVCTWAEEHNVPCAGFGIGVIKKRATGKGNVGKEDVIRACNETFGTDFEVEGYENSGVDNVADAAFVLLLGLEQYGQGLTYSDEEDDGVRPI